jgi:hypothetical protein
VVDCIHSEWLIDEPQKSGRHAGKVIAIEKIDANYHVERPRGPKNRGKPITSQERNAG